MGIFDINTGVTSSGGGNQGGGGGNYGGGGGSQYSSPSTGNLWDNFNALRQQITERNQALGVSQPDYFAGMQGNQNGWNNYIDSYNQAQNQNRYGQEERSPFSMDRGTEELYNGKYRKGSFLDDRMIDLYKAGEWVSNAPSNIAQAFGNEQLAKNLQFNPEDFNLTNGIGGEDLNAAKNFALNVLPGIPGGVMQGVTKGYEALTGTPVTENRQAPDGSGYEIADYKMDAFQRAGAGADSVLSVAGAFTGGSAKVLNVVRKGFARKAETAAKEALESFTKGHTDDALRYVEETEKLQKKADRLGEVAQNATKGWIEKAGFEFGKAGQHAYDILSEGGEEFAQSYLEDIRNKELNENSFDKAVQSAAWGTAGGVLMEGAGIGLNKLVHGKYDESHAGGQTENSDPALALQAQQSEREAFEKFADRNNRYQGRIHTEAVDRWARDKMKEPEDMPGSASAYGTMWNDSLDMTKVRGSLGLLDGIVQTDDNGKSMKALADAFYTDVKTIDEISGTRNDEQRLFKWRELLDKAKQEHGQVRLVAGRNPDTNGVGTFFVDLESIEDGYGVQLNSKAWKALGGDVDGDRYQTYFSMGDVIHTKGYLTGSLLDDSGNSRLDDEYTKWIPKNRNEKEFNSTVLDRCKAISKALSKINKTIKQKYGITENLLTRNQVGEILKKWITACHVDDDVRFNSVTTWMMKDVYKELARSLKRIQDKSQGAIKFDRFTADRMVGFLEQAMHEDSVRMASTFDDVVSKHHLEVTRAFETIAEDGKFLRSGNNRGKVDFADFAAAFDYKTGINMGMSFGNPIMRQTGGLRFQVMKDLGVWFNHHMPETEVQDRFAQLIAFSFSLESIGADVENAIENVFWTSVVESTLTRLENEQGGGAINIAREYETFAKILGEEYKSLASSFNKAIKRPSTQELYSLKVGPSKNPELADSKIGLAQVFKQAFGKYNVESLLGLDPKHPLYGRTFNQVTAEYSIRGKDPVGPFGEFEDFNEFFRYVIKDEGSNYRATESRYRSAIEEAAEELKTFRLTSISDHFTIDYNEDGSIANVRITSNEPNVVKYAIETAHYIFGEDVCVNLHIDTLESFLTSKWGEEWFSGDVDRMINAVFAAKLTYLYNNVINSATKRDTGWEEEVKNELIRLQSEGGIFESIILRTWEQTGDLRFLQTLTSLDVPWSKKSQWWDMQTQNNESTGGLFAEMLATPNSELGTSAFTNQIKKAKRAMTEVRRRSNAANLLILDNISNSKASSEQKVRALKSFMSDSYTTMSTHAIAAFMHSQRKVVKQMMDKGVTPETSNIVYQMQEKLKDGQLFSYLDGIDFGFGNMLVGNLQTNRVQLCAILNDPSLVIRAYDVRKRAYIEISRDAIFKEVLGDLYGKYDIETQWEPWEELFKACPALVSIVTPTHIGLTVMDGKQSVAEGYSDTLDRAIDKFVAAGLSLTEADKQYKQKQLENRAIAVAMRDPNWWGAFVAESGIARAESLAEAREITEAALRRHTKWFLAYASRSKGSSEYLDAVRYLGDEMSRKAWRHVEQLDKDNELAEYLRATVGTVESSIYGRMASSTMRFCVDTSFNTQFAMLGYVIENDEIRRIQTPEFNSIYGIDISQYLPSQNSGNVSNVSFSDLPPSARNEIQRAVAKKLLSSYASGSMVTDAELENLSDDEFKEKIEEHLRGRMSLLFIMQNMVEDGRLFQFDQLYNTFGRVDSIKGAIERYKQKNPNDTNLDQIETSIDSWRRGNISGISNLLFGEDIFSNASQNVNPDVIPNAAIDTWSKEKFEQAVFTICDNYNFNEDRGKIKKAIKRAFDSKNPDGRQEKINIKNYFNQIILTYQLNKITPSGSSQNHLAPKQTIEAYQTMQKVGDAIREELAGEIEANSVDLPVLDFNYEDPRTSVMAAHMSMDSASGAITTGIGLDGGMLPAVAGAGLLDTLECGALPEMIDPGQLKNSDVGVSIRYTDPDGEVHEGHIASVGDVRRINELGVPVEIWRGENCLCGGMCARCAPVTQNPSDRGKDNANRYSRTSRTISALINWMQEPRHLKAKKALGTLLPYDGKREISPEFLKSYSITELSSGSGMTTRQILLEALSKRRKLVGDRLHQAFSMQETSDLKFDQNDSRIESTLLANYMTNFIEVRVKDVGTFIVSASSLASDETFDAKEYDFGFGQGVLPPNDVVSINPVVMSVQEVSLAIVNKTLEEYYKQTANGGKMSDDAIRKLANDAMLNWDDYNSNPITMREFLDGIIPNPPMIDMPALGDGSPTNRMLWDDAAFNALSRVTKPGRTEAEEISSDAWKKVLVFNSNLQKQTSKEAKNEFDVDKTKIVAIHGRPSGNYGREQNIDYLMSRFKLPKDTGNQPSYVDKDGNTHELAEMYVGDDAYEAERVYKKAAESGRTVLVPADVVNRMKGIQDLDMLGYTSPIYGVSYAVLEPSYRKYLEAFRKRDVTIATTEMDPNDEIVVAIGSSTRLGAADASHYTHPKMVVGKNFVQQVEILPEKLIDMGTGAVSLETDRTKLSNVTLGDVDFTYYEDNLRNRKIGDKAKNNWSQSYKEAVEFYLKRADDPNFNPRVLTDVKQGDCVGLVKQADVAGKVYYAPIFYEGTVAHSAEAVIVETDWTGKVVYTASSRNVDYNGNADVKLDLYGIAYKSMGRVATSEILKKWAAIKDGGFGAVSRSDIMFDAMSIGSRLVELGDKILHMNMYFYTRKAGVNAFFRKEGDKWVKRDDLNPSLTDAQIKSLCEGSHDMWARVADGKLNIYASARQNMLFQKLAQESLLLGTWPHLIVNSARVNYNYNEKTGEYTTEFAGLERRVTDPNAIFKNWNTDDFLALWNGIDSRLCPATLTEETDLDGQEKVFDRQGRMLDFNTLTGKPERKITLVGPHHFTAGEGNAISDLSRGATYSNQHIYQELLRTGLYRRAVKETMEALAIPLGNIDSITHAKNVDEELKHWRKHRGESEYRIRQDTYDRAKEISADPLLTSLAETRRENFKEITDDIVTPLPIVFGPDKLNALKDPIKSRDIDILREQFNTALSRGKSSDVEFSLKELVMFVRYAMGTTTHTELGSNTITYDQFQTAVMHMIDNANSGRPIVCGETIGTRGDKRYSIPLMVRGLNIRLLKTNLYQELYDGNISQLIDDQYDMLKASMDHIKTVKDKKKQKALMHFADAMCYANGRDIVSGNLIGDIYMWDLINAARDFTFALTEYDPELFQKYDEACKLSEEWANTVANAEVLRSTSRVDMGDGDYRVIHTGTPRNIMVYTMRQLSAARKAIGLTYIDMPLSNCLDRAIGQNATALVLGLGRKGAGPYKVKEQMNEELRQSVKDRPELRQFWSALRDAQMLGAERTLLNNLYSGVDLKTAVQNSIKDQGAIERFSNVVVNYASGKDWGIEKQIMNFLDRFWQRSEKEAQWWHTKMPGSNVTVFEERLATDPVGLVVDLLSGSGPGKAADALLARQCMQFALAGDNAQKNLVSAVHTELAKQSALYEFVVTTFATPYFGYATNRLGRILNAVAPISSLHYIATEYFTEGAGAYKKIPGKSGITFGDLGLEEVQVKADLKEAIFCDMLHMGGTLVAMTLAGLALSIPGVLEPPEEPEKRGNFEEWTFFGMRINANWWIEDSLGIALPLATFMVSSMKGEPRLDLITGGLAHYLSSNPLVKVSDAIKVLFDPMAELYRDYDNDLEGYAKAMGGPPDPGRVLAGKFTSMGLSYVSQFITPGFLREIYQAGQGNEVSYKHVFQTDKTGMLTKDAKENNVTEYTTYEDAVLRKYTKDNPVMGFLADVLFRPQTGYMNHEMPDRVIYDPELMNSVEAFSMYYDPYTKKYPKPPEEQLAIAQMVISTLQSNTVEDLVSQGFMIDYDTKYATGQVIWDMIATENAQWAELEQGGYLSYYNAPFGTYDENVSVISEMRQTHYNYINYLKELYSTKLWSDELKSVPTYAQRNTEWAQDVNGDWYATGFTPVSVPDLMLPVKWAPSESADSPQSTMSRENDWQTQSVTTGHPLGQRALMYNPPDVMMDKPTLASYSEDGSDTGHSTLFSNAIGGGSGSPSGSTTSPNGTTPSNSKKYPYGGGRGGYGGGGGRRGGGGGGGRGGGGGGYTPSAYAPSVRAPISASSLPNVGLGRTSLSKTMNFDRPIRPDEQYLRPDFETKGSREAYKRSDI